MSCHSPTRLKMPQDKRKVVLVGNPNTGKSVVFQRLTGRYVEVSNFPGTTVDISQGLMNNDIIIDTPGVYGVSAFNDEERVTRDVILQADVIINVVNAVQLKRDLFLTLQLADLGIPMVVAVNMMDEAKQHGIHIELARLQKHLGVPVIPLVAVKNSGTAALKQSIAEAAIANGDSDLLAKLDAKKDRALQVLALEGDEQAAEMLNASIEMDEQIYIRRRQRVDSLYQRVVDCPQPKNSWSTLLGKLMIKPVTGIPLLLVTLYLMYQFIGVFVAQTVVGITEEVIMNETVVPIISGFFARFVSEKSMIGAVLIGEFGLLTMTTAYVLGLLLPLVLGFYFMLAILEDSGYLPRIAALLDRLLMSIGLNGKAVIPTILGFGCVTMATITTRVLGSRRERTIATFLLSLAIPCSAQLGVIAALLAPLGPRYALGFIGTIFLVYVVVGTLLHKLLPGQSSDLFIDLPAIRFPRISNVGQKTWTKTVHFLKEATPLFAVGSILISIMDYSGLLVGLQSALAPLTEGWLRLPRETATAFIMGIVRRDFGAAGLYDMDLTAAQTMISLITITLFVPCIASVIVIWKERGWREWIGIFAGTFATAFLVGGIVARLF